MSTTARISWVDGALFVAEAGSGHTITMDGSPDVVGPFGDQGHLDAFDVLALLLQHRDDVDGGAAAHAHQHHLHRP